MLSSSQESTSIPSSSDSSNIDVDNLDDQHQLFNHILDKLSVFEQNLEKEMNSNSILNKTLKYVEGKYRETKTKLKNLTCVFWDLEDHFYNFECGVIKSEQYSCRQNLIISSIPALVNQVALELKVLEILQTIGLSITSYEIAACHRLKKNNNSIYPTQTLIRFTNRKAVDFCLANRERLLRNKQKSKMNLRF